MTTVTIVDTDGDRSTEVEPGATAMDLVGSDRRVACLRVLEGTSRIPLSR